jgi:hypothetical protein
MTWLAEFASPEEVVEASHALAGEGADFDVYTPYPIDGLAAARSPVPLMVLLGALIGGVGGYLLQWWCNAVDFPINVGGRPAHAPLSFVPITFELSVLLGSLGAFIGVLALAGLPRLHHPVFDAARFRSASIDRFWIALRAPDPSRLRELGAQWIGPVEDAP